MKNNKSNEIRKNENIQIEMEKNTARKKTINMNEQNKNKNRQKNRVNTNACVRTHPYDMHLDVVCIGRSMQEQA